MEKQNNTEAVKVTPQTGTTSNPIKLTFENLEYEVQIRQNRQDAKRTGQNVIKQKIVKGASGYALPGQSLYIMGASGAGKTSLLNMLSDRISIRDGATISGQVMVNDTLPLKQKVFGSVGAYVMQDDVLYQSFTPREALTFAARLKLGGSIEIQDKRVEELLNELGLLNAADTLIGNAMQKMLSGGERKRTAIGVELVTNPSLILLDEPTSGLDSFKALQIVRLLQAQANKGKTVISTIHQPSSESFLTFDRLILMMDGHIVYQGRARDSTTHFLKMGMNCPIHSNPADYYMRILSVNYPKHEEDETHIKIFTDHYDNNLKQLVAADGAFLKLPPPDISLNDKDKATPCQQFAQLMGRNNKGLKRNPGHARIKVAQTIFMGLLCLALFHDQYSYTQLSSLIAGLFFITVNQTMQNMMGTILTFQAERPVFLREQANQMYSVGAYYLAKIVGETPVLALTPMIFSVIVYFKIGLTVTASQFFYFYCIIFLITQSAASFGYFMSSIFQKEEMAVSLSPVIMMPIILFGGQFANSGNIQAWISWFQYVSPVRYGLEALVRNEFDGRTYTSIVQNMTTNYTTTVLSSMINPKIYFPQNNASQLRLAQYQMSPVEHMSFNVGLWKCLVVLAAIAVLFRLVSSFFLRVLVSKFQ